MVRSSLVKSVRKLNAKSAVTASTLRDLYDTLKNRTGTLEALGEKPMSHGCILFETKLPSELLEKLELELADAPEDKVDLHLFFKFLNRQVDLKRQERKYLTQSLPQTIVVPVRVEVTGGSHHRGDRRKPPFNKREQEIVSKASALFNEVQPPTKPGCNFCKADHKPNCPEFNRNAVGDRWRLVQESKLCYNCLKPTNHRYFSQICHHPKCSVENCGCQHHKLLHGQLRGSAPMQQPHQRLQITTVHLNIKQRFCEGKGWCFSQ